MTLHRHEVDGGEQPALAVSLPGRTMRRTSGCTEQLRLEPETRTLRYSGLSVAAVSSRDSRPVTGHPRDCIGQCEGLLGQIH